MRLLHRSTSTVTSPAGMGSSPTTTAPDLPRAVPGVLGVGRQILDVQLEETFGRVGLVYVLVEFPPSRTRVHGLPHLGFRTVGDTTTEGEPFVVYRRDAPFAWTSSRGRVRSRPGQAPLRSGRA